MAEKANLLVFRDCTATSPLACNTIAAHSCQATRPTNFVKPRYLTALIALAALMVALTLWQTAAEELSTTPAANLLELGNPTPAVALAPPLQRTKKAATGAPSATEPTQGILGHLVDETGMPVIAAQLFAMQVTANDPFTLASLAMRGVILPALCSGTSNADSTFRLAIGVEHLGIACQLRGLHPEFADLVTKSALIERGVWRDLGNVMMLRGIPVIGTVTALDSSAPIGGATVTLRPTAQAFGITPTPGRERGIIAITDSNGAFLFSHTLPGSYAIRAEAKGFACVDLQHQIVQANESNAFDLALQSGSTIGGVITDLAGRAIQDAFVRAEALANPSQATVDAKSNADGRFILTGVSIGNYRLLAAATDYQQATVEPIAQNEQNVTIALPPQIAIWLRVVDTANKSIDSYDVLARQWDLKGSGAAQIPQSLRARARPADLTAGRFRFAGFDPGEYRFEVSAAGFAHAASEVLQLEANGLETEVQITLRAGGSLSGTILFADGSPIANGSLRLMPMSSESSSALALFRSLVSFGATEATTLSAQDGSYHFVNVTPGVYQIDIRHNAVAPRIRRGIAVHEGIETRIEPLSLASGSKLFGTVLLDRQPLANARVQVLAVLSEQAARGQVGETRTDAAGTWELSQRLAPGRYQVIVGRVDADNPFLESADHTQSRVELELNGEPARRVDLTLLNSPPPGQAGK